jgi:predicted choloylglycine hydrolase
MNNKDYHRLMALLVEVQTEQRLIRQAVENIMKTLDEVLDDVTDESSKLDSLSTFVAGLKQQIADALAGTTLPSAIQNKIDAVFAGVEANKAKVVKAMDANVPV